MIVFPNCKVNLGLLVRNKRPDGYHNIETVLYPLPLLDILEVINSTDEFKFTATGIDTGASESNLSVKAYRLLKNDYPGLPGIRLHLHKNIPVGAGLGGGSADGAFTLNLLNRKFSLGISRDQLLTYALQLGSDCPFFIVNKPCIATGRGEILREISLSLKGFFIRIINPGIHISTKEIFSKSTPAHTPSSLTELMSLPVGEWKDRLHNDFEKTVFTMYPDIARIKSNLYAQGALYAAMSGTGSSVFGIFKEKTSDKATYPKNYFEKWIAL